MSVGQQGREEGVSRALTRYGATGSTVNASVKPVSRGPRIISGILQLVLRFSATISANNNNKKNVVSSCANLPDHHGSSDAVKGQTWKFNFTFWFTS